MSDQLKSPAQAVCDYAESLGFHAIPQYFALTAQLLEDGSEWPFPLGRLHYTPEAAIADAQALGRPATVAFIVRYAEPADPDEMAAIHKHAFDASLEQEGKR